MISKQKFAEKLKMLRVSKNTTMQELAEAIDVSKGSISQWENGISLPSMDSLYKLSDFFNIDAIDFINSTQNEETIKSDIYNSDIKLDKMQIGKAIQEVRKQKGISVIEIADKLNLSPSAIFDWESEKSQPSATSVFKICEILKVSPSLILEIATSSKVPETPIQEENVITVYGRGGGVKQYKLKPKKFKAIKALLEDDDGSDDIDF